MTNVETVIQRLPALTVRCLQRDSSTVGFWEDTQTITEASCHDFGTVQTRPHYLLTQSFNCRFHNLSFSTHTVICSLEKRIRDSGAAGPCCLWWPTPVTWVNLNKEFPKKEVQKYHRTEQFFPVCCWNRETLTAGWCLCFIPVFICSTTVVCLYELKSLVISINYLAETTR